MSPFLGKGSGPDQDAPGRWPIEANELIVRAVRSAGYGRRRQLRWMAVKAAFACGASYAQAICRAAGFEADEEVGSDER